MSGYDDETSPRYPYGGYPPPEAPPGPTAEPAGQPGPRGTRRTVITAAIVAAVVGGGVGAGTVALVDDHDSSTASPGGLSYSTKAAPAAKTDGSISAAAAKIGPSVVTIDVTGSNEQDTGSGVVIRPDGYILTNNHVIAAASDGGTVSVSLADGRRAAGKVVGTDPSDDLAVVKIGLARLTAATFGKSSALTVGQTVVAVGAPLGLSDTVTSGIVSNLTRPVQTSDGGSQAVFQAVQTDAAINPGNSGGPLVDLNGSVVGINAAIASDQSSGGLQVPGQESQSGNIGIGFAIPSDEAGRIATQLIKTGKATHALMGVTVSDPATASSTPGATVRTVTAGSPGARAGLTEGDVIVALDGQRIADGTALIAAVRSHAPGERITATYQRNGGDRTVSLTLGSASS